MRKISALLLVLLMIAGCEYATDREDADEYYRSGTQGLQINFMPNMPLSEMYDDEPFNVIVEVYNRGATDIETGSNSRMFISGFDPTIIMGIENDGEVIAPLEGKTMYNNRGEYTPIEFSGTVANLEVKNIDNYEFNLVATACYDYQTIAEPSVCIDPEPYATSDRNKACDANLDPSLGSQGAPVQISAVEVEALKGRTKFRIRVNNVGGGTVFKDGFSYLDRCSPYDGDGLEYTDVDYLKVSEVRVSNTDITSTCKPLKQGELRLVDGRGEFICELTNLQGPAYTTPLRITLDYGYRTTTIKPIKIISTPES